MGGGSSKAEASDISGTGEEKEPVVGAKSFALWDLDDVVSAKGRVLKLPVRNGEEWNVAVSRRQFWEVFSDFSRLVGGNFLSLPMDLFDVFRDDDGSVDAASQVVNAVEVLLILGLFCHGKTNDQLRFCFNLFDFDGGGSIDKDEMTTFMTLLTRAAYKVGLVPEPVPESTLPAVTENMFHIADADGGGDVDADEFIGWAKSHVLGKKLLHAFKKKKQKAHAMVDVDPEEKERVKAMRMKLRANARSAEAAKKLMRQLARSTGFDVDEMRDLRDKFTKAAGAATEIDKHTFVKVMEESFPALAAGSAALTLFGAFDADESGSIDFKEFVLGMSGLVRGDPKDKLDLMFEIFDADGNGNIELHDLVKFVKTESDELVEAAAFASEMISTLDEDGDGVISKDEFKNQLAKHPLLLHCFQQTFSLSIAGAEGTMLKEAATSSKFDLGSLRKVWHKYSMDTDTQEGSGMNMLHFRRFMMDEFKLPLDRMPLVNKVFEKFDTDDSGFISLEELFNGLAQVMDGTVEQKSAFYFQLYDIDGGGTIDSEEIMTMLISSRMVANSSGTEVADLLKQLDQDGDGSITVTEFKSAVNKDPRLLECFGRLFGVTCAPSDDSESKTEGNVMNMGVVDMVRKHREAAEEKLRVVTMADEAVEARAKKVEHVLMMQNAMTKFRRMSLPSMAMTVAALQTELEDPDERLKFHGRSPAAVAARNYGASLADALKKRKLELKHDMRRVRPKAQKQLLQSDKRAESKRRLIVNPVPSVAKPRKLSDHALQEAENEHFERQRASLGVDIMEPYRRASVAMPAGAGAGAGAGLMGVPEFGGYGSDGDSVVDDTAGVLGLIGGLVPEELLVAAAAAAAGGVEDEDPGFDADDVPEDADSGAVEVPEDLVASPTSRVHQSPRPAQPISVVIPAKSGTFGTVAAGAAQTVRSSVSWTSPIHSVLSPSTRKSPMNRSILGHSRAEPAVSPVPEVIGPEAATPPPVPVFTMRSSTMTPPMSPITGDLTRPGKHNRRQRHRRRSTKGRSRSRIPSVVRIPVHEIEGLQDLVDHVSVSSEDPPGEDEDEAMDDFEPWSDGESVASRQPETHTLQPTMSSQVLTRVPLRMLHRPKGDSRGGDATAGLHASSAASLRRGASHRKRGAKSKKSMRSHVPEVAGPVPEVDLDAIRARNRRGRGGKRSRGRGAGQSRRARPNTSSILAKGGRSPVRMRPNASPPPLPSRIAPVGRVPHRRPSRSRSPAVSPAHPGKGKARRQRGASRDVTEDSKAAILAMRRARQAAKAGAPGAQGGASVYPGLARGINVHDGVGGGPRAPSAAPTPRSQVTTASAAQEPTLILPMLMKAARRKGGGSSGPTQHPVTRRERKGLRTHSTRHMLVAKRGAGAISRGKAVYVDRRQGLQPGPRARF